MSNSKKIMIKNIYYMMSYAFQNIEMKGCEGLDKEDFDDMHNLFAAMLSKMIGYQLKHGLYREYISKKDNISTVRGKIDIVGTIKNQLNKDKLVLCEFDELSENNILNQIIKTTVMLLLKHSYVSSIYKNNLKKKMLFFSNIDTLDPKSISWSSIRFERNSKTYRTIISICQLVIEEMLMTTDSGEYRMNNFIDSQLMCRLYEKFILEYYRKHYPQLNANSSQLNWAVDDGNLDMLPRMQTDVHLELDNNVLIIDAKYYNQSTQNYFGKNTIHSANLYQIFTYVKNRKYAFGSVNNEVSGLILYAKTEDDIQPNNVYKMHGNKISVKTLDLNKDFSEIKESLDNIIKEHYNDAAKKK